MTEKFRWGILGCGSIAGKFARQVCESEDMEIAAAGSRNQDKAKMFLRGLGLAEKAAAYGSYEALVEDSSIDAVYVATPHSFHRDHTLMAFKAGKPVLCEKPLAVNSSQAREMIETAGEKNLFLMEGMWTAFNPLLKKAKKDMDAGKLGDVRRITADFSFKMKYDPAHRLFNPALAGGALLDIGIYPLFYGQYFFGSPPDKIEAAARFSPSGVDVETSIVCRYSGERQALLSCAFTLDSQCRTGLQGTGGSVVFNDLWFPLRSTYYEGREETMVFQGPEDGYLREAREAARCVREGLTESPYWSLEESLNLAETMDRIREKIGLVYPMEKE